jgi:hypothetical protein
MMMDVGRLRSTAEATWTILGPLSPDIQQIPSVQSYYSIIDRCRRADCDTDKLSSA